jgi:MraZ protein
MNLFISQYTKLIDKRGRITVPHDFRDCLNLEDFKGFVAFASHKSQAIECCGISKMERLAAKVDEDEFSSFFGDQNELITSIFADSHKIMFDEAGRVMLPIELTEHAQLSMEVLFVGIGKTFQIWDPLKFKLYRDAKKAN